MTNNTLQDIPDYLFSVALKYSCDTIFKPSKKISIIDKSEIETNSWNSNSCFYPDCEIYDNENLLLCTIKDDFRKKKITNIHNINVQRHANVRNIDCGHFRQLNPNGFIFEFSYDYHVYRVGKDNWEREGKFYISVLSKEKILISNSIFNIELKINTQIQKISSFIFDFWILKYVDFQDLDTFLEELMNCPFWLFNNGIKQYLQQSKDNIQAIPNILGITIFLTFLLNLAFNRNLKNINLKRNYEDIFGINSDDVCGINSKIYQIHNAYILFENDGVHVYLHNLNGRVVPSLLLFIPKTTSELMFNEIETFGQTIISLNIKKYLSFFL